MPPILRSKGGSIIKTSGDEKAPEPHPTYDEEYFANDILLASEPVIGEPGILVFSNHPYITLRVGNDLAVFHINAEKWNLKSDYGKDLCSRMSAIGKFKYKKYRVDLIQECESIFSYYIEYINTGSYRVNMDTFRGSFCSQLKLYDVARRYGTADLAEMVLRVISDMLVESHPEQITRICFWSLVVSFAWDATKAGDPLRDIISGFPTWYSRFGKGRAYNINSSTVQHAFFNLKLLPCANPFYQIAFALFKDHPDYLKEKLDGYLGETRPVSLRLTQSWRDTVDDPTFENWFNHWKSTRKSRLIQTQRYIEELRNNFYDSPSSIKLVDDEDKLLFSIENKEKKVSKRKQKRKQKGTKRVSSKKRSLSIANRAQAQEAPSVKRAPSHPKLLDEALMDIQEDEVTGIGRDIVDDTSSDLEVYVCEDISMTMENSNTQAEEDAIYSLISLANGNNEYGNARLTGSTNLLNNPADFGYDGTYDILTNRGLPFVQTLECIGMSQYIPPTNDGHKVKISPFPQDNGTSQIDPRLVALGFQQSSGVAYATDFSLLPSNLPGRKFDARFSGDRSLLDNPSHQTRMTRGEFPSEDKYSMVKVSPRNNGLNKNVRYEGLDSEEWQKRNQPMCAGQYGSGWVHCLKEKAEHMSEMEFSDMSMVDDGFHGLPILNKFGQISIWNCGEGKYELQLERGVPDNFQYDHRWSPQEKFYLPCEKSCPTSEEWAGRLLLSDSRVSMVHERTALSPSPGFPQNYEMRDNIPYHQTTREFGGGTHWAARQHWSSLGEPGSFANNEMRPSYLHRDAPFSGDMGYGNSSWGPPPPTQRSNIWSEGMWSFGF